MNPEDLVTESILNEKFAMSVVLSSYLHFLPCEILMYSLVYVYMFTNYMTDPDAHAIDVAGFGYEIPSFCRAATGPTPQPV